MSFLTPLYILGALAVAAPILFHLIRRMPRGEVPFSSLMFLSPTPPRLTRRSRIDHWLLLLLRSAALILLAIAFARPFLREAALLDSGEGERRRVAVLIDTSASLRRGDLWARSVSEAERAIGECRPGDALAVLAFDATTRTVLGFAEASTLDPSRRQAVARSRLAGLSPTWHATDFGRGLIDAVGAIEDVPDASEEGARAPRRIILISDLQEGSRLDALGGFEWPSDVALEVRTVSDDGPNATLLGLGDAPAEAGADALLRVRVANAAGSGREQFSLAWDGEEEAATPVYVPPGESRVVRVNRPAGESSTLRLSGDSHTFDNALFLARKPEEEETVLFVGDDALEDPNGLLYYLSRVFEFMPGAPVRVRAAGPSTAFDGGGRAPLFVLAAATTDDNLRNLRDRADAGATVLVVLTKPEQASALAALAELPAIVSEEAKIDGDVMLGEIAFDHPLFAPLAGAQFNDFTKIHFWKYRRLNAEGLGGANVLARFEDGAPAVLEARVGKGRVVVMTSGWAPGDSQLARSSKFVALMAGLLGRGGLGVEDASFQVGDPLPLVDEAQGAPPGSAVRKPDGSGVELAAGLKTFGGTDEPGIYVVEGAGDRRCFAVNLDPSEGDTAPLAVESLEQFGCRLAGPAGPAAIDPERSRQLRNGELEGRQKAWRWLVVAVIVILIVETALAGRRRRSAGVEGAFS